MAKIVWDQTGQRTYETGCKNGVLYPQDPTGTYPKGVAWNGLIGVNEAPSGAEANPIYADDIKYLNLMSNEDFKCTIEAYTFPEEFKACDGTSNLAVGVSVGQQPRRPFGLAYKTTVGNDTEGTAHGYKLHLVYGGQASPSAKAYKTMSDNPEAITFSWEVATTPVDVPGKKPSAKITIDSKKADPVKLAALEVILFGDTSTEARLPLPAEIVTLFAAG